MNQLEKRIKILFGCIWGVVILVAFVICLKAVDDHAYKMGYNQGRKDALYKRPVSEELDLVCAGLWIGKENLKYQQREMKK